MEQINELVLKSKKGDRESFGLLYDLHVKSVYKFVYFKTHHKETAEDLTSKIFLKALEKIKTYKLNKSNFSTWLFSIARNTVIDFYRTDKKDLNIEDAWDITDRKDFLQDIDTKIDIQKILNFLSELSTEQRDIIILKIWQDLSYKEISEIIGKSEENCRVIFSRSIKQLKNIKEILLLILFINII